MNILLSGNGVDKHDNKASAGKHRRRKILISQSKFNYQGVGYQVSGIHDGEYIIIINVNEYFPEYSRFDVIFPSECICKGDNFHPNLYVKENV